MVENATLNKQDDCSNATLQVLAIQAGNLRYAHSAPVFETLNKIASGCHGPSSPFAAAAPCVCCCSGV